MHRQAASNPHLGCPGVAPVTFQITPTCTSKPTPRMTSASCRRPLISLSSATPGAWRMIIWEREALRLNSVFQKRIMICMQRETGSRFLITLLPKRVSAIYGKG